MYRFKFRWDLSHIKQERSCKSCHRNFHPFVKTKEMHCIKLHGKHHNRVYDMDESILLLYKIILYKSILNLTWWRFCLLWWSTWWRLLRRRLWISEQLKMKGNKLYIENWFTEEGIRAEGSRRNDFCLRKLITKPDQFSLGFTLKGPYGHFFEAAYFLRF